MSRREEIGAILEKGNSYMLRGNYRKAVQEFRKGEEMAKDNVVLAMFHRKIAEVYEITGKYDEAIDILKEGDTLLGGLSHPETGRTYVRMAYVFWRKGKFKKSLRMCQKALTVFSSLPTPEKKGVALAYNVLGLVNERLGDYKKALQYHQQSLAIREKIRDKKGLASSFNNIGNICFHRRNYDDALEYYEKALILNKETENIWWTSISYNNIGGIYYNRGDFKKALKNYRNSLKIAKRLKSLPDISMLASNIASSHYELGKLDMAWEEYQKALEIKQKIGDKYSQSCIFLGLGNVLAQKGKYHLAREQYERALRTAEDLGAQRVVAESHLKIAEMYVEMDDTSKAIESADLGIAFCEKLNFEALKGKGFMIKGIAHRHTKPRLQSIVEFENSINLLEQTESYDILAQCYYEYGSLWKMIEQRELAKRYFDLALSTIEKAPLFYVVRRLKDKLEKE